MEFRECDHRKKNEICAQYRKFFSCYVIRTSSNMRQMCSNLALVPNEFSDPFSGASAGGRGSACWKTIVKTRISGRLQKE